MIKHIVFFRLADKAEGKSKIENARIIKEGLLSLVNKVPCLKQIEVGLNIPYAPATDYDIALTCLFDTWDDLNTYAIHPEHLKVAAYIGKCKTSRAACDYEI